MSLAVVPVVVQGVLQLEPTNLYDSKCVAVCLRSSLFSDMLGHLAREDAVRSPSDEV